MTIWDVTRRSFLRHSATGLGSAWLAAHWPAVLSAQQAQKLAFFTPDQAAEVDAICAQIIPTDSTPGAREARCVNFIDRFLVTYGKDRQALYARGLQDLEAQVVVLVPGATRFSKLTSDQQIKVLTAIEKTPFFSQIRTDTITGMFADPKHGGNYNQVGWKLIGYNVSTTFPYANKPPFGSYDAVVS
jgi:gluconate 2-dehydrogenase gamma chain